jgi:hypothetical protein
MVSFDKQRIDSIGSWLSELSPQTAEALQNYTQHNDLFEWKKYAIAER